MTGAIANFCLAWRRGLFALALGGSLLLASGIFGLGFDSSLDALLTRSDPYVEEMELLQDEFPGSTAILFAFLAPEGESLFTRPRLQAIDELRERWLEIPLAARQSSLLDYYSPRNLRRLFDRISGNTAMPNSKHSGEAPQPMICWQATCLPATGAWPSPASC